ncbi:SH3 domain-containing protein [Sulfitobacter aestuariivivens]|uniref:SH3 domain-containing protein n=1 Tax=Sulfitobacter aestuariivivens TaxID=2766981 RepID=A0A927D878_9RHOB|nr:SH3 domain-containing protein [Sulfitobacter aestuariivivens]MBD3665953.1 SH3 domain-containing protein [Sulfitobacter aestuariivivens]
MKRFILLTFGFLGWAFYEMSGGAAFEPASAKAARLQPAPEVVVAEVVQEETVTQADAGPTIVDTDPPLNEPDEEVTRVSLNLTTLQNVTQDPAPAPTVPVTSASVDAQTGVAINSDVTLASADTPAIIPSLIIPNDTGAATVNNAVIESDPIGDIRTVTGSRVNVRGGPGTDFGIVSRLVRGDAVEVLQDDGDGWVLMRSIDSGEEGWMADFLLTAG